MTEPPVATLVSCKAVEKRMARCALQVHVQGCIHTQPAFMNLVSTVLAFKVATNLLNKIRRQRVWIALQLQLDRLIPSVVRLGCRDLPILEHRIDHEVPSLKRPVRMVNGRVLPWRFGKSRQQCCFIQRELFGGFAEVIFRSSFEPIGAVTKKNLVRVKGEYLFFREATLNLNRQQCLFDLAMEGTIWRQKEITRELHRKCRCALDLATRFDVAVGRSGNAPYIDAPVPKEVLVFNGCQSIAQNRREVAIAGHDAPLQRE